MPYRVLVPFRVFIPWVLSLNNYEIIVEKYMNVPTSPIQPPRGTACFIAVDSFMPPAGSGNVRGATSETKRKSTYNNRILNDKITDQ
jgi:hypothetical protein